MTPSIKVLPLGGADLFGSPSRRAMGYTLWAAAVIDPAWAAYDASSVRTLISTGDTCPDRGVSYEANILKRGWDWVLDGGNAHYIGFWTTPFDGRSPLIRDNGDTGTLSALISDNDVSANDFECPVIKDWFQHDTGKVFTIDPRAVTLPGQEGRREGRDPRLEPHHRRGTDRSPLRQSRTSTPPASSTPEPGATLAGRPRAGSRRRARSQVRVRGLGRHLRLGRSHQHSRGRRAA